MWSIILTARVEKLCSVSNSSVLFICSVCSLLTLANLARHPLIYDIFTLKDKQWL